MSPDLERVIGRGIADKAFRDNLLADPEKAVNDAGFTLTPDELKELKDRLAKFKASNTSSELDKLIGNNALWW